MKILHYKLFAFILLTISFASFGQLSEQERKTIDSLKTVIKEANHDSVVVNAWKIWENIIYTSDIHQDSVLLENIVLKCKANLKSKLKQVETDFFTKELARAQNYFGACLTDLEHFESAIQNFNEAIEVYKQANIKDGLDGCYINFGNALVGNGQLKEAIIVYNLGIKMTDQTQNYSYRSNGLMSIGNIYLDIQDPNKALEYFNKSKNLAVSIDAQNYLAMINLNMGNAHLTKEDYDSALFCYNESLKFCKKFDESYGLGTVYHNKGQVFLELNKMDSSLIYFNEGLKVRGTQNLQADLIYSYAGLSSWHTASKNAKKAVEWGEKALQQAKKFKSYAHLKIATNALYEAYALAGEYKKSLETYIMLRNAQDSLQSKTNQKELINQEVQYEYEREKMVDSLAFAKQKAMDDLVRQKDKEKEAQEKYILYGILSFALLLIGLAFVAYRRKKKDNSIITKQKEQVDSAFEELEEKNQEIMDSISYAKRIQTAILPPDKLFKTLLPNSFVLYKPKDIVAGDFYWLEEKDNKILFAAADCTGHGVPGAMVSVICNNGLNRSVREYGLVEPGKILDKTREIVIQEFEKSEEAVKDGMDIALCSIEGSTLKYAGAHNPIWIVRNGEIFETKADKQPIGKFDEKSEFTTHSIPLEKDDAIYIFSDGYADQFGGEKGKKFKPKAFKKVILSVQDKSMEEQKTIIDQAFEDWKGNLEQLDDVCVIGVKV